jgi:membrane protein CcdC involved in cytochrome C biogenesis
LGLRYSLNISRDSQDKGVFLNSTKELVFVMEVQSVFCITGTEVLNAIYMNLTRTTMLAKTSSNVTLSPRVQMVHFVAVNAFRFSPV